VLFRLPRRIAAARRIARLALFAVLWQALQPFATIALAADDARHDICPSTGLHTLALPGGDDSSDGSATSRLHCGFCVGVQAPTISAPIAPSPIVLTRAVASCDEPAHADSPQPLTAPPLPARGPPRLS
jgi:hypothetical protein